MILLNSNIFLVASLPSIEISIFEYCGFATVLGDISVPLFIGKSLSTKVYPIGVPDEMKYPLLELIPVDVDKGPKTSKRSEEFTPNP